MKICFVDSTTGTLTGGSESIIYNLACELSKRHEVSILTGRMQGLEILSHIQNGPFKTITVPYLSRVAPMNEVWRARLRLPLRFDFEAVSFFIGFLFSRNARRHLSGCDVVSFHYPMTSLLFSWYLKLKGIPSVFHTPGHVNGKRFFRFNRSTLYLGNSYDTERKIFLQTDHHADGVVTPGVLPESSVPRRAFDPDKPILVAVSRFTRAKGVFRLLEIFALVRESVPGARLVMLGLNYEGTALHDAIVRLGLEDAVQVVGRVPFSEVGGYYSNADMLLHPSYPESFGMVVLEAMSYGIPVAATNISSFREASDGIALLLPGASGVEWPRSTYQLWAREIASLFRDPERMAWYSAEGRKHALRNTWDKKAVEYEGYLAKAVAMRGRTP